MGGVINNLFNKRGDDTLTVERSGRIFRQKGPPLSIAGHVGNFAIDVTPSPYVLYQKGQPWSGETGSAWVTVGTLAPTPAPEAYGLKWYSDARLSNSVGDVGDYAMYTGEGAALRIWGPKNATGWPENGDGGVLTMNSATTVRLRGLSGDGGTVELNTQSLVSSTVATNAGNVTTTVVTTTTNQRAAFTFRGLLSEIGSALGVDTSKAYEHGLASAGREWTGTYLTPADSFAAFLQSLPTSRPAPGLFPYWWNGNVLVRD